MNHRKAARQFDCLHGLLSDPREDAWHKQLCNGKLALRQAQRAELAHKRKHG